MPMTPYEALTQIVENFGYVRITCVPLPNGGNDWSIDWGTPGGSWTEGVSTLNPKGNTLDEVALAAYRMVTGDQSV